MRVRLGPQPADEREEVGLRHRRAARRGARLAAADVEKDGAPKARLGRVGVVADLDQPAVGEIVVAHPLLFKPRRRVFQIHGDMAVVFRQARVVHPGVGCGDGVERGGGPFGQRLVVGVNRPERKDPGRGAQVALDFGPTFPLGAVNPAPPREAVFAKQNGDRPEGRLPVAVRRALQADEGAGGAVPVGGDAHEELTHLGIERPRREHEEAAKAEKEEKPSHAAKETRSPKWTQVSFHLNAGPAALSEAPDMLSRRSLCYFGALLLTFPAVAPAASSSDLLHQLDEAYVGLFNQVAPSVVIIDADKRRDAADDEGQGGQGRGFDFFFRAPDDDTHRRFRMPEKPSSEGSGFFVRPDGYIITNNHVIDGAEKITVKLKDGRQLPAKLIGADDRSDIAVLKVETSNAPVAPFADSDQVRIGQHVCAIGAPFSLDYSFSIGCISGKGRTGFTNLTYEDYLQTDAFINPGNSGGPLFDVDGRVVGMNTLINAMNRGLAFAIPSNMLKNVSDQLIAKGRVVRPWLGIRIETLGEDSTLRDQIQGIDKGVIVSTIDPETPAYKSDLRPADVITEVDGVAVATARDLQKLILTKAVGQSLTLTVWRKGKTLKIHVTTGELPASQEKGRGVRGEPEGGDDLKAPESANAHGLTLQDLTKETAERLGSKQSAGAVVGEIEPGSPAAIAGIQPNDIVTEIDGKAVANAAEARRLLREHDPKKAILLFLERKGQKTYAVVKIEK